MCIVSLKRWWIPYIKWSRPLLLLIVYFHVFFMQKVTFQAVVIRLGRQKKWCIFQLWQFLWCEWLCNCSRTGFGGGRVRECTPSIGPLLALWTWICCGRAFSPMDLCLAWASTTVCLCQKAQYAWSSLVLFLQSCGSVVNKRGLLLVVV